MVFIREPDWWNVASCKDGGLRLYFASSDQAGYHPSHAKRVCAGCPVLDLCLYWALAAEAREQDNYNRHGIFGGATATQRQEFAKMNPQFNDPEYAEQAYRDELALLGFKG